MGQNPLKARTRRDLTIVTAGEGMCLVISCDSCGAIGLKAGDVFQVPPRITGQFTARVALTEVMCSGAMPVTVANGVACEMTPTGEAIISGIRDELENAGLTDIVLTGSTEENFPTSMTALAVTVIGVAREADLKFGPAVPGDKLILYGSPETGAGVDLDSAGFYQEIRQLLPIADVREIVPVGSKGVAYEAETLSSLHGMAFKAYPTGIDYDKSAGPSTCLLVLCAASSVSLASSIFPAATVIGELR